MKHEALKSVGYDVVRCAEDPHRDECLLTLRIEGCDIRMAAFGRDTLVDRLVRTVDMVVGHRARQKWYASRPVPRLSAGTHAYRGKR